ncbi:MAG: (d)CMP kinase [Flavobacteriia bacterium]|nr:(d)CMP kinase [Flavobacteriia bacterium]
MLSRKKITIAIDGFASSGKSTLGKDLAKALGYVFIDSGAMYRGVALFSIENGFITDNQLNAALLIPRLSEIHLEFVAGETKSLHLNGRDVSREIRSTQVSEVVSEVAALGEVRQKLVQQQQAMGKDGGIVMDGRDIGTVVFPHAELKLFVTANLHIRSERRFLELTKTNPSITMEEVAQNLALRDSIDTTRAISPLRKAEDAIELDTGKLNRAEQLERALSLVKSIIDHED